MNENDPYPPGMKMPHKDITIAAELLCETVEEHLGTKNGKTALYWQIIATIIKHAKIVEQPQCDHEWVDATNEVVTSGQMCKKCLSLRCDDGTIIPSYGKPPSGRPQTEPYHSEPPSKPPLNEQ